MCTINGIYVGKDFTDTQFSEVSGEDIFINSINIIELDDKDKYFEYIATFQEILGTIYDEEYVKNMSLNCV